MIKQILYQEPVNLLFIFIFGVLFFSNCSRNIKTKHNNDSYRNNSILISDSKLLQIYPNDNFYLVDVINPWDTTKKLATYVLANDSVMLPADLQNETIIRVPLKSAAVTSSAQCSFLDEVDGMNIVEGAGDLEFLKNPSILKKKSENKVYNIGSAYQLDAEMLLSRKPQVVFIDPIIGQDFSRIQKNNLNIIYTPDYLENTPLGRLEWIKFYALLMGEPQKGDSIFQNRKEDYQKLKLQVESIKEKPTVFMDLPYQGSWNISGGKSYIARMLNDAGANYIWRDDNKFDFTPLSFEAVLDKAGMADIWLIKYYNPIDLSYTQIKADYKPYTYFKAFKDKKIWGNNTMKSSYYEDLPTNPHLILEEMVAIFHPDIFPNHEFKYYSLLK